MNEKASNKELSNEEALQQFLLDINCLDELLPWIGSFNVYDVLKISRTEIRHSNTLSWLLDPLGNHDLGDEFIKSLFQRLVENDSKNRYKVLNVLLMNFYSFNVKREWKNIDILLVSSEERCVMAIENKVGSHEHSNQLNRYRETLEKEYADYTCFYVFLTPDGEEPSDVDNWDVLSYTDLVEVLETVYDKSMIQEGPALMIKNYISVIRRDIVEDPKLIEICNKIYSKHRKALDLIFENRSDSNNVAAEGTRVAIKTNKKVIPGRLSGNSVLSFYSKGLNTYLGPLDGDISSWADNYSYRYEISIKGEKIVGALVLGGDNLSDDMSQKQQGIISILKPNNQRDKYKFITVYKTKKQFEINEEDSVDDISKKVNFIIDELLSKECEVLKSFTEENHRQL